ncbi:glutathione S-transferase family protein [Pseudoruegeria sp. SK021]|uniref:glutathione S-transferase family protein n=1 Tax=Pseudoruegeria sp. SK021 TaxID=1933035 RepID=UPI000A264E91|nr:glutathione S-transferase family protein [Pseudoruegeria sp. SK021]OSP55885.1 glutathione S-transferase [Pseudoruegeria sp. SK021]
MPTLFHAPNSRSSSIVSLIDDLGADIDIREVTIPRMDGSGAADPQNPHPDRKVPVLVDGGETIHERGAIILYLTDKYPAAGLGPVVGAPGRGAYLSWLSYYQGVMEPLFMLKIAGVSHPVLTSSLRDFDTMTGHLANALSAQPYLLGAEYSAADLLCSSPFHWMPDMLPASAAVRDWVARCADRPALKRTAARDSAALGAA